MNTAQPLTPGKPAAPATTNAGLMETITNGLDQLMRAVFSLTHRAARNRRTVLEGAFTLFCLLVAWRADPAGWVNALRTVFTALFQTAQSDTLSPALWALIVFILKTLIYKGVLKTILVVVGPYLLGWYLAAHYLQDIFELGSMNPATRFIQQAALAEPYQPIHIRQGSIEPAEVETPVIQIGGPGYIQVELDSAALIEKSDGESYVVGPTLNEENGDSRVLQAFERVRDVIDLRDITTEAMTTSSRSRDGIPVIAKDLRLISSVRRSNQKPSLERPYPFMEKAIRDLVYQQAEPVKPGRLNIISHQEYWKQTYKRWSGSMPGLIRSSLDDFVSEHSLSEFLANIGEVELESLRRLEQEIRQASETITPTEQAAPGSATEPGSATPSFQPRSTITNLFYDFTSGFSRSAENKGVQLEWIGIGTWSTPASAQLINESHLEAWRISRENYLRGHPETLKQIRDLARLQELQTLLQGVVLATYRQALADGLPPQEIVQTLLLAYREKIKAAWDLFEGDRKSRGEGFGIPEQLTQAVRILNDLVAHHVN
jgi:hypothetical protein